MGNQRHYRTGSGLEGTAGLNAINVGDTPTFERGNSRSHIDITWATNDITERVQDWKVLRGEFFTFHNHIYFEITNKIECRRRTKRVRRFLDKARFVQMKKNQFSPSEEKTSPSEFIDRLSRINRECTISVAEEHRDVPYWWNGDVEWTQRNVLLRVASAFRTVSASALQTITGILPIDLMVQERAALYLQDGDDKRLREEARQQSLEARQARWNSESVKAQWTKHLIKDIKAWVMCAQRRGRPGGTQKV
ncbi:hypothetical protein QE152_g33382 [Popillia japonica]|uniref:Uncharacterized protein n=1 Tax=Popillia japonica TaxID=7064 RepID=A0AAW1IX21_POPJA